MGYHKEVFAYGPKGYFTKDTSSHELFEAIHQVMIGGTYLPPSQLANKLAIRSFDHHDKIIQLLKGLSDRELEAQGYSPLIQYIVKEGSV